MSFINGNCQVFTPPKIVIEVLNQVNYKDDLYGKKVLENSCGDGSFLVEIVNRYIKDCLNRKFTNDKIIYGLEQDIYGAEIDEKHKKTCIDNLNEVTGKYNIYGVKWNILQTDILHNPIPEKFQFIIGNPPYITYRNLDIATRKFLKENFKVCSKGTPDYYYAFIELSIKMLSEDGRLAYLIPNNIFKNRFADKLRIFILPYLSKIIDYTTEKLFKNKLTSSAIIICEGLRHNKKIYYKEVVNNRKIQLSKNDLTNKWVFREKSKNITVIKRRFGDDFHARYPIATLLNRVFIFNEYSQQGKYVVLDGYKIENKLLREAISPRSLTYKRKELLIFPYSYNKQNQLLRYGEKEFIEQFPEATKYLRSFITELNKRDNDASTKWFEYGRSQALLHLNQEKLLISTLITDKVKTCHLLKNQIPYAGICIYPKSGLSIGYAEEILKSNEFLEYVYAIGINGSGSTMRITTSDINNFTYTK